MKSLLIFAGCLAAITAGAVVLDNAYADCNCKYVSGTEKKCDADYGAGNYCSGQSAPCTNPDGSAMLGAAGTAGTPTGASWKQECSQGTNEAANCKIYNAKCLDKKYCKKSGGGCVVDTTKAGPGTSITTPKARDTSCNAGSAGCEQIGDDPPVEETSSPEVTRRFLKD
jgi:hypothetical protein